MWIVWGTRTSTELVPDGARVERVCDACGTRAMFYERRAVRTFELYFIPAFDYRRERVMACGACGVLFRTDEQGVPDASTSAGWERALANAGETAMDALASARDAVAPAARAAAAMASEALSSASAALGPAAQRASQGLGGAVARLRAEVEGQRAPRPSESDADHEATPVDPEKEALLKRFAELEARMKKREG